MLSLMLGMCRPIFLSWKAVVSDSGFCVAKGTTYIKAKGVYVASIIKKRCYFPKVVPGNLIDTHFEDKGLVMLG